jgi:glutamate carboxypeptidase
VGATTRAFDAPGFGRNLRADFAGADASSAPLVVLAHIDTVHPKGTLATLPFRVLDDRAEGPGIYDMKTGLALAVEAIAWLHERGRAPHRPVILLVTCDEEIGSHSARALFQEAAEGAYAALVPEPAMADGSVKTARKGVSTYALEIEGRAAHAGVEPEKAVSAVRELAHLLPQIHDLEDRAAGTTVNVGVIHAGTASNVVPARAVAAIDVRAVTPAEAARVHAQLLALRAQHPEARVRATRTEQRGPLVRTPGVVQLYQHARDIAAQWDIALGEGMTGGGSDGSLMAELGVPVLDGLGARGGGAHAKDEHVLLEDLPFRLALMAALLETL